MLRRSALPARRTHPPMALKSPAAAMRSQWLALASAAFGALAAAGEPTSSVESLYEQHCLACHGASLQGSAHGPPLKGDAFLDRWSGSRQALLAYNLNTMPPGGSRLGESEHAALVDFLLTDAETDHGDLQAGDEQSAVDSWSGVAGIDEIARSRSAFQNRQIEGFEPVSDARLRDPPPGDWLHWRRTQDGQAHSPLNRIDRANVDRLQLAWAVTMRDGSNQVTPLVHDGILYLTHPDNVVQALDAATGELIWEYAYDYPPAAKTLGGPLRNIAIHGDKLFLATYDAALVAIDARTGNPVWRTVKADYRQGYTHTSGPILGGGVLLSGINGCERVPSRWLLPHRARPRHGPGALAHLHDCIAGPSRRRNLGRAGGGVSRRRRCLDRRQL